MITLQHLSKSYGEKRVLCDVNLTIPDKGIFCLMAPSGAGKTTLLRLLMGLETPDSGEIVFSPPAPRIVAVFQEDRLCPGMNAISNIRLVNPALTRAEVLSAMQAVGLFDCADQPARELSGGMARRVAILRALLAPWDLLILDEPFKGLDEKTKRLVLAFTAKHIAQKNALLVTHDSDEAKVLGARILDLNF